MHFGEKNGIACNEKSWNHWLKAARSKNEEGNRKGRMLLEKGTANWRINKKADREPSACFMLLGLGSNQGPHD